MALGLRSTYHRRISRQIDAKRLLKVGSHLQQTFLLVLPDNPLGIGAYIQQQDAVVADRIVINLN